MICYRCGLPKTQKCQQSYVDSTLVRDKVITLENVTLEDCQCGATPVYPKFRQLLLEIKLNPLVTRFRWDDKTAKWLAVIAKASHFSANGA